MKQLKITKFPELDYAGSEAFNTLSTNLSFAGETVKKIMITSCHASEGKSYLSSEDEPDADPGPAWHEGGPGGRRPAPQHGKRPVRPAV